jgi:hypothetical protein
MSVLKLNRPVASVRSSSSSNPGSKNGAFALERASILSRSTSMPTTSWPSSAIDAA